MVTNCDINLLADDTLVSVSDNEVESAIQKFNSKLENILKWLELNELKLNTSKTKAIMSGNNILCVINGNIVIDIVLLKNSLTSLVVILSLTLWWHKQ